MTDVEIGGLLAEVDALHARLVLAASMAQQQGVHESHRASVANMLQFLALRAEDHRELQGRLARHGLSSLGRCEPHVLATVHAVRHVLLGLVDGPPSQTDAHCVPECLDFDDGESRLERRAEQLLGKAASGRTTRIMVTLPSEAATDAAFVEALVVGGMQIARINCAHDDSTAWTAMASHVRDAARAHGLEVRVLMDLAGPKLRTGPVAPAVAVVRLRPRRDDLGGVVAPARAQFYDARATRPIDQRVPLVPIGHRMLRRLDVGDRVQLVDARGAKRTLRVVASTEHGPIVQTKQTTYLVEGTELRVGRHRSHVSALPERPGALLLHVGDQLELTNALTAAVSGRDGEPTRIGCTLPAALEALRPGHRVLLDDGKIAVVVTGTDAGTVRMEVTAAADGGAKLRSEKGINVPDTHLPIGALTDKDELDLETVAAVADIVALSFVREPSDVALLNERLEELGADHLAVVLKIETTRGFAQLPALLQTAMARPHLGVMIARGDLAVEAGYERTAELQEEILWLCEAAHVPVIWATEVLDNLAKTGRPTRAEITDAAMADRAECVMLNKGPHILSALRVLDDVLTRMASLQSKKNPLLRRLTSWT